MPYTAQNWVPIMRVFMRKRYDFEFFDSNEYKYRCPACYMQPQFQHAEQML